MKKWLIISVILVFLAGTGAVLIYKFVYNKPHPDYAREEAVATISAKELYEGFKSNPKNVNPKYMGKVIAVTGKLTKIETTDSLTVAVFVFAQGDFGDEGVRCTMLPVSDGSLDKLKPDMDVSIKGLCNGFNDTDVILEKCTIIH